MNKYVVGAILALITYILVLFFIPLIRFRPWLNWWKLHQPKNETQNCMPLTLLAYQSSATWLYGIASLFLITENQKLGYSWQADFLLNIMGRWAVDLPEKGDGFLTPYALCTSVAPRKGQDAFFNPLPNVQASGDIWPNFHTWPAYVSDSQKKQFSPKQLWWGVLSSWGLTASKKDPGYNYDPSTWKGERSNFLWNKYQIPGDSNLCLSFVTDDAKFGFPEAMSALLGIDSESGAGGWVGVLRGGGDWGDYGLDEMDTFIWADNKAALPKPKSPLDKCGGPGVASAVTQGLNLGLAAAMALGPFGWIAALGGFAAAGVAGGLLGASQYKCFG